MQMANGLLQNPPGRARGRPFEKGRSGNPAGRRIGSRNKATSVAAALLEGESEALTRKAVELALAGDPTAMRLCLERILAPCRERTVKFQLPPIESAADIAAAMKAVTSALAGGAITPGEAGTIAAVVDTFVHAIRSAPCPDLVRASTSRQPRWLARQKAWVPTEHVRGRRPTGQAQPRGSKVPWPSRSGSHDKTPDWADISTGRRDFAADSLQEQQRAIADAIHDCVQ